MDARRWLNIALLVGLITSLFSVAGPVEAASLTLTVRSVDASQFPKVNTTIALADSLDVPPPSLALSAVSLTEDNVPVSGVQIEQTVDPQQAFAVALLIDTSGTMNDSGKLAATKQAVDGFIDELGSQDSVALLSYSDRVKVLQGYTSDKNALKQAVTQLSANGPAAVYDAIDQAVGFQAVIAQKRKVLLVLTDGGDTASKQSLDAASSAARGAHVPIYAIGLGSAVRHDMLDQLAGNTSGQVTYVAGAADLTPAFQDFADRLRRLFILSYTSKLTGDDHSHNVNITVKQSDQTLGSQGKFVATSNALSFQVSGIANASRVTATPTITVTLSSGQASQIQLLVDDQSRASLTSAPYLFHWDTSKETPGIHRVVIRATGPDGKPTDREFVVEVLAPTPTAGPTTAANAIQTAAPATATPIPAPASNPLPYALGGLAIVILVGAIVGGIFWVGRRKPAALPPPAKPIAVPPRDQTEVMTPIQPNATQLSGATVVNVAAPPRQPRAHVHLVQHGTEQEIALSQPETVLGRDASNPIVIRDPLASRRHARIAIEDGAFWIEDLKSLNHTRVNGAEVTRQKLANGDQIKIGEAILTFTLDGK